jgi:hypothetical protein
MVGNPSAKGSARVTGAERVFTFSAALKDYVPGTLIGVGRGAWACNDSRGGMVTVAALDVTPPNCCTGRPRSNNGNARLVFANAGRSPLIVGVRQMDGNGDVLPGGGHAASVIDGCGSCPEQPAGDQQIMEACTAAPVTTLDLPPGSYAVHIQRDAPNVPDDQFTLALQADMGYAACIYVASE